MRGDCTSREELVIGVGCVPYNGSISPVSVPVAVGSVFGGLAACGWCLLAFIAWTRRPRRRNEEEAITIVAVQRSELLVTHEMHRLLNSRKQRSGVF
jgi:hypothetical protein